MTEGIAVVTGGAGGIGAAVARRLRKNGYGVAIMDINREGAEIIGKELGTSAVYAPCNVTELDEVQKAIDDIESRFGEIEALINTAGGHRQFGFIKQPYWETDLAERETVIKVNLYGTLNTCYAVLPWMVKRSRGNIVNIVSSIGLKGGWGLATYSAAKGGIVTFTQALALEAGPHGVRVNSIAPGGTEAPWRERIHETVEEREKAKASAPLRRRAFPEDVAAAVSFLISEDASHITGACIDLSGGTALH